MRVPMRAAMVLQRTGSHLLIVMPRASTLIRSPSRTFACRAGRLDDSAHPVCCARRLAHTYTFTSPQGVTEWLTSCTVRQANLFAQSRVTNYLKRAVGQDGATQAHTLFTTTRVHASPPIFQTTLHLPVDVLVQNQVTRCDVEACGFGADARASRAACCMHAERCLDALGVALFASPQRQDEHAKEALRDGGRIAPKHGDLPNELADVTLPPPFVASSPLYAILTPAAATTTKGTTPPASSVTRQAAHTSPPRYAPSSTTPSSPTSPFAFPTAAPAQRHAIRFDHHYGPDPFLHRVEAEMDGLRDAILTLQTTAMAAAEAAEGDDDEGAEWTSGDPPVVIEESEVAVLQPDDIPSHDDGGGRDANRAAPSSAQPSRTLRAPRVSVAYRSGRVVSEHHCPERLPVDESEAGRFDLVEGITEVGWWTQRDVPTATCLYDVHALHRIKAYYHTLAETTPGSALGRFEDTLTLTTSEESTSVRTGRGSWRAAPKQWWTASAPVPRYESATYQCAPLRAIGKAMTVDAATVLCAMHMESLLGFLGEPIRLNSAAAQWQYYDACLCWARPVAPTPWLRSGSDETAGTPISPTAQLPAARTSGAPTLPVSAPKPLKQWFRPDRHRLRHAPLTVTEKLLTLNRAVVTECRQHLTEVDIFDPPRCQQEGYTELLALAVPCLRAFLRAQGHPYEGAYFIFAFTENFEYRASLYLPLPARYGVRGGYAVASTPERAQALCALHAIDILCSLGIVPLIYEPPPDDLNWSRLLVLREKLHLTLPVSRTRASGLNPQLRSPPAYRESPGHAATMIPHPEELWRTMLLDAAWFDVVPDGKDLQLTLQPGEKLPYADVLSAGRHLFLAYVQASAGWTKEDVARALHHYCGRQHYKGHRRRTANTYWMQLPLDASQYGPRVAIGRCVTRKGAERNFYLHAFRILATLGLVPWMTQSMSELQKRMYSGDTARASLDMSLWRGLAPLVIDPAVQAQGVAVDAIITQSGHREPVHDKRTVASPHPIMSYELARGTL